MRELSLHLLDVMENSIRAGANVISVTINLDAVADSVTLCIEDNGPGLAVPQEVAADPFYTTKKGKRTGLGLALLKGAAEIAGGDLVIGHSSLGGASVTCTMGLSNVDRVPLGDLGVTIAAIAATHPEIDLHVHFRRGDEEVNLQSSDIASQLPKERRGAVPLAQMWRKSLKMWREI
jgi:hypothetical protein